MQTRGGGHVPTCPLPGDATVWHELSSYFSVLRLENLAQYGNIVTWRSRHYIIKNAVYRERWTSNKNFFKRKKMTLQVSCEQKLESSLIKCVSEKLT